MRSRQKMPFSTCRPPHRFTPRTFVGNNGRITDHSKSVRSNQAMLTSCSLQKVNHNMSDAHLTFFPCDTWKGGSSHGQTLTAKKKRASQDAACKVAQQRLSVLELAKELGNVAEACKAPGLRPLYTRPYSSKTNEKAERFIPSSLREWACGRACRNPEQRRGGRPFWLHHYDWHRPTRGYKNHLSAGQGWI